MSDYTWYRGVERLQDVLGIDVDGKYGPETDTAFRVWMRDRLAAGQTEEGALRAAGLETRHLNDIISALAEYRSIYAADAEVRAEADALAAQAGVSPGGTAGTGLAKTEAEGWPWWKWGLVLAGGAAVVYAGYKLATRQKVFGGLEDTGGCSCSE